MNRYLLVLALCLSSCKTMTPDSQLSSVAVVSSRTQSAETMAIWNEYVASEVKQDKLQTNCEPTYYEAKSAPESKGIVIYFHGFTPCPQQFFDMGKALAEQGYDVFIPLLPGHGRVPLDGAMGNKEDVKKLPERAEIYEAFVQKMVRLAASAKGDKIAIGLSGGSNLATAAIAADPKIWSRALIMAPFYKIPGALGPVSATIDFIKGDFQNSWGQKCKDQRKQGGGRAGICDYEVNAMRAILDVGIRNREKTGTFQLPVQFVGKEADKSADNTEMLKAAARAPNKSVCFYPQDMPHAFVNPAEVPDMNFYWMDALRRDMIAFVSQGTFFPQGEPTVVEEKSQQCLTR